MASSKNGRAQAEFPNRWNIAGFVMVIVALPVMLVDFFVPVPVWAMWFGVASLVAGAVLATIGASQRERATGRSTLRVLGSTVWAPFKFILDNTF
ncbi:hypothetical protein [Pengzhenrongella sicca]|uniref:Uncharacterized protein n=1 Tax=Pengzhenrongella sicca TaxID=2819238 RepID=A0A8A4ZD93_9MICO|nr:hypothetical protein [Pengzhenrongella sicca]QTE28516.1 hypothetical protein J4E96_14215 [Pengzhenrongella sicca]